MSALAGLLRPASVAVVGASTDLTKVAGRPVAYLQKHHYGGALWPVHPRADRIAGLPCYPSVADLPAAPDVGLVMLGPERAEQAVRELAARGTRHAIVLAGGYGETGASGRARQDALRAAAGPMRLLGPNTIGLVNLTDGITLSASGALEVADLPAGQVALVSQSGGILGAVLSRAAARGIGFSSLVATGNEADLDLADFLEHFATDPASRVIALYIEGIRDPARFRAAAARARAAGKALLAFKVGRSEAGRRAAVSHTGALAGADRVYDALFADCGIVRARSFDDFIDLPAALVNPRRPRGARVAILTSTGGAGTLLADSIALAGLDISPPGAATAAALRALDDDTQMALERNPIDVTLAGLQPRLLRAILACLATSPDYDALVVIVGSSALAQPTLMADALVESLAGQDKPILAYVSPHAPAILADLNRRGVPAFATPEGIAAALAALQPATVASVGEAGHERPARSAPIDPATRAALAALPAGACDEATAKAMFARCGIATVRERRVSDAAAATDVAHGLGGKVVLKLLAAEVTHKTELGGVVTGLDDSSVGPALDALRARLAATGMPARQFVVQEMVAGVEMLLGLQRDPQLGLVLLLGMGGVDAELLDDTRLYLLPTSRSMTHVEARALIAGLRMLPLLTGWRNQPRADLAALADAIVAFAKLGAALGPRLVTAEINPLFVLPEGQGVRAADGVLVLGATPASTPAATPA